MTDPEHDEPVERRPIEPPESVEPVSAEPVDPDEPRRYPSTIGGAFYLLVLGVVAAAMVIVALDEWRTGIRLMGGALVFAALVRLVLRRRDAGMLAVRHKVLDAVVLAVLGGALIFLATSIPDQPGF
ncbi:putative integral membrane protein [metagenome]|uniref:Putative integral membrane protein n=1 Tax=metagenome TaxID=256318 RepID=A0A2P2CIT2_9ZZZZ